MKISFDSGINRTSNYDGHKLELTVVVTRYLHVPTYSICASVSTANLSFDMTEWDPHSLYIRLLKLSLATKGTFL